MSLKKNSNEKVDDYFSRLYENGYKIKDTYQNIHYNDIKILLTQINRYTQDTHDVIWCLLNNEFPCLFANSSNLTISNGASVAHIGGYIGILMRGKKRLDREGRDIWIKPLRDIGIIEEVIYHKGEFLPGHLKAKSPNSAYRLNSSFIKLLNKIHSPNFKQFLDEWISTECLNERLQIHLNKIKTVNEHFFDNDHKKLIEDSINIYAQYFLKDYIPIFKDSDDGDRITLEEQNNLDKYGINFGNLDDVWPDVILYNKKKNSLWFIEAVTSDGEIDLHKMEGLQKICANSKKVFGGATTTYLTWDKLAKRQKSQKNLCINSYIWIKEDPEKQFFVK